MKTLTGKLIYLRAIEPTDLEFLYEIENNESFWEVSNTITPFSKFVLHQYLENAQQDIYTAKQLRMMIVEKNSNKPIGMIDLFDFEPKHKRAGIGIVINTNYEGKGYAAESLKLLINYAFTYLDLHQVYANISEENNKSISLFEKQGFIKTGLKKDWIYSNKTFKNELIYQLIHE